MEERIQLLATWVALSLEALAIVVVAIGAVEAVIAIARVVWRPRSHHQERAVWLGFARWLVAALTFQLAADIVQTTLSSDWNEIARVGAVAVIRTFLTYFLDRDMDAVREKQLGARIEPGV